VSTLKDIVIACENVLGWTPPAHLPLWKARAIEIAKLKRAVEANPRLHTIHNLQLAIEYSRRKKEPITSPAALVYRIDKALELAPAVVEVTDLEAAIQAAIDTELMRGDTQAQGWIGRLTRAFGPFRAEVYTEWLEAGRG